MSRCILVLLLCLSIQVSLPAQTDAGKPGFENICLSDAEQWLARLINEYRKENHLKPVAISRSLSFVAHTHACDLAENYKHSDECNMHSWSDSGNWSACCYTHDHKQARCMWDKPRELTGYPANGYEISFYTTRKYSSPQALAADILKGWKESKSHNEVILNKGIWKSVAWKAMGIGINENFATVWFGEIADPEGVPCQE
ncbi:MAG TPA: CAP domain-containing protein [Bacteroidales bacterium]|nr:CAP domain-containing protein [Bacteroidales bacterium]